MHVRKIFLKTLRKVYSNLKTILTCSIFSHKNLRLLRFTAPRHVLKKGSWSKRKKRIKIHKNPHHCNCLHYLIEMMSRQYFSEITFYITTETTFWSALSRLKSVFADGIHTGYKCTNIFLRQSWVVKQYLAQSKWNQYSLSSFYQTK